MDQDERQKERAGKPKPIPIREAVGEPGQRTGSTPDTQGSTATPQAPGLRGQRERPAGPGGQGASRNRDRGRQRRPDRKGAGEERQRPPLERTPLEDLPFRGFEHDGCEWIVRLCGQTSTGSAMDPGAPLMHLVFYLGTDPLVARGDVLEMGRSLDEISELRLSELLSTARLARSANESSG